MQCQFVAGDLYGDGLRVERALRAMAASTATVLEGTSIDEASMWLAAPAMRPIPWQGIAKPPLQR